MPVHSYLEISPDCPNCGANLSVVYPYTSFKIQFQWGYCPHGYAGPDNTYHVGQNIKWHTCPNNQVIPNSYFPKWSSANIGDPAIQNLVVTSKGLGNSLEGFLCPHCHVAFGGCAIEIKNNIIQDGWVYLDNEFIGDHNYYHLKSDGSYMPLTEMENVTEVVLDEQCNQIIDS